MDTLQKRALRMRIVSMTGIIESFMERRDQYWGYVKMVSLEKPPAS